MGDVKLVVERRESTGKGAARKLRQRGLAPGVVYGGGGAAASIAFDAAELQHLLTTSHGGLNTLIDLEGDSEATGKTVIAKDLQREAVRGGIIHGDFYEVDLTEKIHVSVPVHLVGNAAGVLLGGVLDQQLREVELLCLPNAIPDDIETDVTDLELGDSLHVSDLTVPFGVELNTDESLTVATVLVPRGLVEDEEPAEGEDAEAGEEVDGSGDDKDKDADKDSGDGDK